MTTENMKLTTDNQSDKYKGITETKNGNGFAVFKLHYTADPNKTEKWAEGNKRTYPSMDIWNQEMELDFTKSTGLRIYPDFKEHVNVKDSLRAVPYKDVFRFWDFGYRHPVVIFAQINNQDQLVLLDEVLGQDMIIPVFAKRIIAKTKEDYSGFTVRDFGDPAGRFASDKSKLTTMDFLRSLKIHVRYNTKPGVHDGINLVRALILEREDGEPGMIVDRKCKIAIDAFLGGYTRSEITDEPEKDGYYEHPMDAVRYGVVNLYNIKSFQPMKAAHPFHPVRKEVNVYSGY